jgi:cyclic pyranopterin monophosphate synthase
MSDLAHFDEHGASRMVDVSAKPTTVRTAVASGRIEMAPATLRRALDGGVAKGNVREVARLAGIMAAKRTSDLIPLCHPLALDAVDVAFAEASTSVIEVRATCRTTARTGVEMEALAAVAAACLTIYDMCKSMDRGMTIAAMRLESKSGGRSGEWRRER